MLDVAVLVFYSCYVHTVCMQLNDVKYHVHMLHSLESKSLTTPSTNVLY